MKHVRSATAIATLTVLALPFLTFAQVYYYAPGTTSGAYNYDSYIPSSAMPYVELGSQMQEQSQEEYGTYSYPTSYSYSYPSQYQSQSQYETSYPSNEYSNSYSSIPGYYTSEPQSVSYPSGTTGPFGTPLCYWSDYPTYAPCGQDPQQWIQDPYTGEWY